MDRGHQNIHCQCCNQEYDLGASGSAQPPTRRRRQQRGEDTIQ
ncbi:hypothetical protein Tco_0589802, partial [Tanacetum coccineum]